MTKIIVRIEAHYEVEEVELGKVYKWHPAHIVLECQCGERLALSASTTSCVECASDHVLAVKALKEVSTDKHQSDQTLHPWRYSEKGEDGGLPF